MSIIDTIELYRVRLPLVYPFGTAYGTDHAVEPVVVCLRCGDDSGWAESQPFRLPTYCPEYSAGVFRLLRDVLAPAIVGRQISSGAALQKHLAGFKGNPFAKGGLDMAWWDLHARRNGLPLWQALGGKSPVVEVGADFGIMDTIDALLERIGEALDAGFKRIKLKYAPGWDLDMVTAVREAFPRAVFHIDCNSAYTLDDIDMFRRLDRLGLAMIEQPLAHDDLVDHATLQKQLRTPICLDESITSPARARKAIEIGACGWVNIKPVRMGGHTPALEVHDLCRDAGVPCWIGGMVESGLGGLHCLAMATLANVKYPSDIFPSRRFFTDDLVVPDIELSGPSQMTTPDSPGIGRVPDPERLDRLTVEKAVLTQ
jgi:O-succinylbenzoate synthase